MKALAEILASIALLEEAAIEEAKATDTKVRSDWTVRRHQRRSRLVSLIKKLF